MALGWHVAYTRPRMEYSAATELAKDGIEVFFPCIKSVDPRPGHTNMPLFPGYLFIRCDLEDVSCPSFRFGHPVLNWVRFDGVVPTVPAEIIVALAQRIDEINNGVGQWQQFSPGDKVRVVSQVLEGIGEIISEAKSPDAHAKVLLQFMGRLVEAKVPWRNLEPIGSAPEKSSVPLRRTRGRGRWIRGSQPSPAKTY